MNLYVGILLGWVVVFPRLFSWAVPFIYAGIIYAYIFRSKTIKAALSIPIVVGFSIFIFLGIVVILINTIKFGDNSPWTYWVAGFATWFIFIVLLRSIEDPATTVHKALIFAGYIAGLGNLLYLILFFSGVATEPISVPGYQAYFGLDDRGFFAYSTSHLPLIAFLVPYFTYKATNNPSGLLGQERLLMALLVLTGLLSLRSIIWIVIFISFFYYVIRTKNIKFLLQTICMFLIVLGVTAFSLGLNIDTITGIYELKWGAKVSGEDVRYQQLIFWISSFLDAPLIGHGLSSVETIMYDIATGELLEYRPGPVVSNYGYEILYGKLLSDIGLIFFIYVALFAALAFSFRAISNLQWQVGALRFGALCMVLQSGTNSYLLTSGWLFTLMLPLIFIVSGDKFHTRIFRNKGIYETNR